MRKFKFDNSMEAWETINELFLKRGRGVIEKGNQAYMYDVMMTIENPKVDPDFDLGRNFNYTSAKWSHLVSNYIDKAELMEVVDSIKKNKLYNIPYRFTNKHDNGKACLLSMVFSKRVGVDKPNISVYMRASEVTKRLICDLLLIQRVGEIVFKGEPFTITMTFNQMFNEDHVLFMYSVHKPIGSIKGVKPELIDKFREFILKTPDEVKYKVHRRANRVLRPDVMIQYPETLTKNCQI